MLVVHTNEVTMAMIADISNRIGVLLDTAGFGLDRASLFFMDQDSKPLFSMDMVDRIVRIDPVVDESEQIRILEVCLSKYDELESMLEMAVSEVVRSVPYLV